MGGGIQGLPVPAPGVRDLGLEIGPLRLPTEKPARPGGIGDQARRVAGPARSDPDREIPARDAAHCLDHLAHGKPALVAQVERGGRPAVLDMP